MNIIIFGGEDAILGALFMLVLNVVGMLGFGLE